GRLGAGRVPAGGSPRSRILLLGVLLLLTLFAIRALRNVPPERSTILIGRFQGGVGGPDEAFLEALTDRVATRVSRLPQVRMVVLDRDRDSDPTAAWRLGGTAAVAAGEIRVEARLQRIGTGAPPEVRLAVGTAEGIEDLAAEIAGWVEEKL
ncbi:MAG: hypothetical protein HY509_04605, partial [Acidobacteria bacterium]|nr:hypothetical protein [Acidobacteriota bacterium]